MSKLFYVISLKWTKRDTPYITVWRPNDCGYAWPLSWAGRYEEDTILGNREYYHRGDDTMAIACELLDEMAVEPAKGMVDGNVGPVVMNTKANWLKILQWQNTFGHPLMFTPRPEYKGAPRRKAKL